MGGKLQWFMQHCLIRPTLLRSGVPRTQSDFEVLFPLEVYVTACPSFKGLKTSDSVRSEGTLRAR